MEPVNHPPLTKSFDRVFATGLAGRMCQTITIRPAAASDQGACEVLVRDAFWNLYRPGCHEHFIWHCAMQGHPDVVDELTLVAVLDDEVVGCVMSTRAHVLTMSGERIQVLAPGPLAVAPARQRHGIGGALLRRTLDEASRLGFPAACLYGDPGYYPRFGFMDAATYGIATAEGDNFPEFMAIELVADGLAGMSGCLVESSLFDLDLAAVAAFDAHFPVRVKVPRLVIDELVLTDPRRDDAQDWAAAQDDECARWFGWPSRPSIERCRAHLEDVIQGKDPETYVWAIRTPMGFAGGIDLKNVSGAWNVSYFIAPERRGQRIARRALRVVVDWAFRRRGIETLTSSVHVENIASQKVLESVGFVRAGIVDNPESGHAELTYELISSRSSGSDSPA